MPRVRLPGTTLLLLSTAVCHLCLVARRQRFWEGVPICGANTAHSHLLFTCDSLLPSPTVAHLSRCSSGQSTSSSISFPPPPPPPPLRRRLGDEEFRELDEVDDVGRREDEVLVNLNVVVTSQPPSFAAAVVMVLAFLRGSRSQSRRSSRGGDCETFSSTIFSL